MSSKTEAKARVFVLQNQNQKRYDISAVKYYSDEIVYVIGNIEHISPFDTPAFIDLVTHRLIMENFNPEIDFICLTGSSILLSLFAAILGSRYSYANLKVLMFDARNNNYKLRLLNLRG